SPIFNFSRCAVGVSVIQQKDEYRQVTEIVLRDSEGLILASCTYHNPFIADATTAEAKACLQAVMVAEELSFRNLTVEGDSLTDQRVWIEKATHKVEMIAEKDRRPPNGG
ncbi:hypothetical protein Goshw_020657, partial [Gossypium schwendimanii]|nr:hypothetical protein [Gossypium schwendimanii]